MSTFVNLSKRLFCQTVKASTKNLFTTMELIKNMREKDIRLLADDAVDWAYTNGLVMKDKLNPKLARCPPFMLLPSPFPQELYEHVRLTQKDFQTLMHRASLDEEFIYNSLKSVMIHDDFTGQLYKLYSNIRKQGISQKYHFNIARSDYMIDQETTKTNISNEEKKYSIKQVEYNTIAVAYAGLGSKVAQLHKYMYSMLEDQLSFGSDQLPANDTINKLGMSLATVWKLYGVQNAAVVFVLDSTARNRYDQKLLKYSCMESLRKIGVKKHVPVLFHSLHEIGENGILTEDKKLFLYDQELAVCYFRMGFSPGNYPTNECWRAREIIERSLAIKCPTIGGQLVGTKKIQQVFASPGMVERFIHDPDAVKRIRKTFAGLYTLDPGPEGDAAANMAIENPSKYILKPQREGGYHNLFDDDIAAELNRVTDPVERSQYILMDKINPPRRKNYMINIDEEQPVLIESVSELGIYGVFISDGEDELVNEAVGHVLRSKDYKLNEGHISGGSGGLDSPYLV